MNNTFFTTPNPPEEPFLLSRHALTPEETRRTFSRLGLSMLVLTAGLMVASYAIQFFVLFVCPQYIYSWWLNWVLSFVPLYGVGLPLMLLSLRSVEIAPHNADYTVGNTTLEKPRFHFGHWMILLVIAFGCMYTGSLVGNGIMNALSAVTGYSYANSVQSMVEESPVWMTLLGTCVCAPIGEEFIFRKVLIDRTRRFGDTVSILISGFFFGLFHGNLFQFFYAFLLGMVLAYIYTRSGKLGWCVAMHAVVNFIGSILMPALQDMLPADASATLTPVHIFINLFLVLWIYGSIIAAIVLLCTLWSKRKLSRGSTPLYWRNSASLVMLNPGMLANYIVMCLLLVVNLIPQY